MGSPKQNSSLVHDPLGLLAMPMTSICRDQASADGLRPGTHSAKSSGMTIAAKTVGAALVAVLIMVSLVSLPGPAKEAQAVPHCHLEVG